jgi:two-component system sensor histidine kinase/response regulator
METDKITVLYLDDEENNLNSFKAAFRMDYKVLVAKNAEEADAHLNNPDNQIEVVISDQRMPTITGVEFFENIRLKHPNSVRLLMTGYSDLESVIDAINRGHIFRYIKKPWVELDVKSAIEEAHKFYLATSLLTQRNTELQKAYSELSKFAYMVAHDFKGPVMSIQGALSIISDDLSDHPIKELVTLTAASAQKLREFVDSMFEYYKLNQGELLMSYIDFNDVAQYYKDLFAVEAKLKNVDFTFTVSQNQNFRSDLTKIQLILNNLINNSFKFLKHDHILSKININVTADSEHAIIVVSDNGIGIEPQYIDSVFEMFFRATTYAPGSGFGLFNVKDAVTKLDGTIAVNSAIDEGTSFTVTLPTK